MTSVTSGFKTIPANKLWVNIASIASSIVDSNNNLVSWALGSAGTTNNFALGLLSTPGQAVLRDMGTNVYLPSNIVPTSVGGGSTILRGVQLVTTGTNGYYGTGTGSGAVPGSDTDYYTGYIRLNAATYAGGGGPPTPVARIN